MELTQCSFRPREDYENVQVNLKLGQRPEAPIEPGLLKHAFSYSGKNTDLGIRRPEYNPVGSWTHYMTSSKSHPLFFSFLFWNKKGVD